MHRAPLYLGVALLFVLAGCTGPVGDGAATGTPAATVPSSTGTDATTATPTPTPPPNLSADNPFGQAVVPVRVNDTVGDGRNTTKLVARAIDYWNGRIERQTAYDYRFVLADEPENARVEVRFVDEIDQCGRDHDVRTVGCAPLLEPGDTADPLTVARVEVHGSNSAVTGTVMHELGHVLGLRHDDEPLVVMAHSTDRPIKDATERAVPWYTNELSVYVDHESLDGDRSRISAQVGHALEYYNEGAAGTIPENVTFTRTDHEASADVVITNAERYPCGGVESGSRMVTKGYRRLDDDADFEIYARLLICMDVDDAAVGWHVGSWLGQGMGLAADELAPPFRDAGYRERRSDWWE